MDYNSVNKTKNIKNISSNFPILKNNDLTYLDSAASAQKPYEVIECIEELYSNSYANLHRGVYSLSQIATDKYE